MPPFLKGGGEMGELIRNHNWAATSLGPPETWPVTLKQLVAQILSNPFPMLICWGNEYIQFYNDAFRPINGESKHPEALGGSARVTYAEIWDTIGPMFASVMQGQPVGFPNFNVPLHRNGYMEECYFDFSYSPIKDENGQVHGILVICVETTDKVLALEKARRAEAESNRQGERLHAFFMQAPAGICILNGPDLVFELINPLYQQFFPGRELLGKPLLSALPELAPTPVGDILQQVMQTGETYHGNELLVPLARTEGGPLEDRYFDFIYQARLDAQQRVDGVLVFVIEVTGKVLADRKLQNTADTLKLAMETANMGTWAADLIENTLTLAARSRQIYGIPDGVELTFTEAAQMLPEAGRERVLNQLMGAVYDHKEFDLQYQINPLNGGSPKWIRSTGMGYYDPDGKPISILGTIFDITEQKADEQLKNDFIGMVSHELKTPLTSLTAIVQVANAKLKESGDVFLINAMDKAAIQVKKMSNMINGFLNVSRLESGKMQVIKRNFNLDELLHEVIKENEPANSTHTIRVGVCDRVNINADPDKIGSVISNFISNAVKYSPKGTAIDVSCRLLENEAEVSVRDRGLGIKETDINHVFDRYFRAETNQTHLISGFGIGLYLCAEIIKQHNGKIWVESEPGAGSIFYFTLPL